MNLFIPAIGTIITLEKDWEFEFKSDYRNYKFWSVTFPNESNDPNNNWNKFSGKSSRKFNLLRGTVLKIERVTATRIHIRNSIMVSIRHDPREEINKKIRLYVSLEDANKIVCSLGNNSGGKI